MPTPFATAEPGTRGRADTAWQSVIADSECPTIRALSTPTRLADGRPTHYDRSSMVPGAMISARPETVYVAPFGPIASPFIAPKRR
jgi:hypothetical protein